MKRAKRRSDGRTVGRSVILLTAAALIAGRLPAQQRPMTFLDGQQMRNVGAAAISPDGTRVLYTLSTPDWKEARRTTDIWLVAVDRGVASTRQMTFTKEKDETAPRWSPDGSWFLFSSNREGTGPAATSQLYLMRPDGGEARKLTDAKDGVAGARFTRDGRWLVYAAGKAEERQLWALPVAGIDTA